MNRSRGRAAVRFAASLKAAREAVGFKQTQVAGRMRDRGFPWTQGAMTIAESGRRRVKLDEAEALAEIVCVPLERMLRDAPACIAQITKANVVGEVIV